MNKKPIALSMLAITAICGISGCGGSPTLGTGFNPRVRVVDALTFPTAVTVSINGSAIPDVSSFQNASSYQIVTNGNRSVVFTNANLGTSIINMSELFQVSSFYTVIGYQGANSPALLVLKDSNNTGSAQTAIRFEKVAAGAAPAVDFYVTQPGADITNVAPIYSGVTLGNSSQAYVAMTSGTYEVRETASGSKAAIIDQQFTLGGGTSTTVLDVGQSTFLTLQDQ